MKRCASCPREITGAAGDALSIDNDGRIYCARCGDDHARLVAQWARRGEDYEKEDARRC